MPERLTLNGPVGALSAAQHCFVSFFSIARLFVRTIAQGTESNPHTVQSVFRNDYVSVFMAAFSRWCYSKGRKANTVKLAFATNDSTLSLGPIYGCS